MTHFMGQIGLYELRPDYRHVLVVRRTSVSFGLIASFDPKATLESVQ